MITARLSRRYPYSLHLIRAVSKLSKLGELTPLALAVGLTLAAPFPALAGTVCDGNGAGGDLVSTAAGGAALSPVAPQTPPAALTVTQSGVATPPTACAARRSAAFPTSE